ncbi:putative sporulation protein YtaF [Paenibacillus castaneae]|uniref:manganese efflux pump n=1 Tax=Paenibacillus castaneae TaxID=474957 RepID=UPI000C9A3BF5|nr:manganese efflux pump [Paenibacillus castaneae]NIK76546.1 putative sporulation protein YtaF [Paenibacillus castaneae]
MHWISIILIGMASNIDNLGIGVSYGARSLRIPILSNLFIAILAMVAAYASITMGGFISGYFPKEYANVIGGIIIIGLGIWSFKPRAESRRAAKFRKACKKESFAPFEKLWAGNLNPVHVISWKQSISLGFALSINGMAMGFGAGVTGTQPLMTTISIGVFSLITVAIGERIGYLIARTWLGKYSNIIGGLMLISIGLYEIFF